MIIYQRYECNSGNETILERNQVPGIALPGIKTGTYKHPIIVASIYNNLNHKTDQVDKLLSLLICSVIQNGDTKVLPPLTRCRV